MHSAWPGPCEVEVNNGSAICGFDPQFHPIGYALILEKIDGRAALEMVGVLSEKRSAPTPPPVPDLFGWEIDPAA